MISIKKQSAKEIAVFTVWFCSLAILVVAIFLSLPPLFSKTNENAMAKNEVQDDVSASSATQPPISEEASNEAESSQPTISSESNNSTQVNINTADLNKLITLKGIGEKTAQEIIDYRSKNGDFTAIEQIMDVKGIAQKKFDAIKHLIIV